MPGGGQKRPSYTWPTPSCAPRKTWSTSQLNKDAFLPSCPSHVARTLGFGTGCRRKKVIGSSFCEKKNSRRKTGPDEVYGGFESPLRSVKGNRILALLVESLIEREIRWSMKKEKTVALPIYPEGRSCKAPTANRIFELFEDVRRHRLATDNGSVQKRFYDDLTELERNVLRLLGQSPATCFSASEKDRAVA